MKRALLAILVVALAATGWTLYELYHPYRAYTGALILTLEPGTPTLQTARLLVDRGVLAHRWAFLACYALRRPHRSLKAGEYLFDRPLRPIEVYHKMIHGDVYLHTVVIPEGSDRFDIARILHQQLGMDPQAFLRASAQPQPIHDLDPSAPSLEGYLFPDTYRFPRGVTPGAVIITMLARFRQVLRKELSPQCHPAPEELRQVITLASLVEKETPSPGERPVIAGVFENRLKRGMLLQCDPTVVYAARLMGRPIGPITQNDLQLDSPYNTYRHAGLPPGPIANPGEASIRAALQPEKNRYLYFVSNHHGGHVFSTSLAGHQRNVARYRSEVAALRRAASKVAIEKYPASPQHGKKGAKAGSNPSGENAEQETGHPRALPGAGSRARRGKRDPGSRNGTASPPGI